ncbi:MAG: gamma carbonic anhydrase family protein [Leptospiraceae bacterium]|nr:gamma carbonic anhydrase family protein [Leptospiraceae bacterium]MDW7975652.1 gamma carbonic anhydrase family protein [Leptospiraceae bacterium]
MIQTIYPVPSSSFVHEGAYVIGKVLIGEYVSIWPGVVIRGDLNEIKIGNYVNIQDNAVLHVDGSSPIEIGAYSLIGHMAVLHGCKIGKACMIGIRSIVMDDAEIGDGAMITADCIIRGKMKIPPFSLVTNVNGELKIYPDKAKTLYTILGSLEYVELAKRHKEKNFEAFTEEEMQKLKREAKEVFRKLFPERVDKE